MGSETLLSDVPSHAKANTFISSSSKNNNNNNTKNKHTNSTSHNKDTPHIQVLTNHDHPIQAISPMPSSFIPNSNTNASVGCSYSSTINQSKENLNAYQFKEYALARHSSRGGGLVGLEYDRDEISTQSSNFTHHSKESSNGNASAIGGGGGGGMIRSKSRIIFSDSEKFQSHHDLKSYYEKEEELEKHRKIHDVNLITTESSSLRMIEPTKFFGRDIRTWTNGSAEETNFDKYLRHFIDIHIAKARRKREEKYLAVMKKIGMGDYQDDNSRSMGYYKNSISSNTYIPYPSLRHERRFLYDVETYPLHIHLAQILGVSDLSMIHNHTIQDKKKLMKPLLDARKREAFHKCYDNFVTSFCIPLLHSLAMSDNLFNESSSSRQNNDHQRKISYRYQAFPCIRVNRPGEFSIGPHCDMAYGHSMGNINFHIPLTPTYGTNALYTESHPGREDWHPLKTKSIGLGYSFDGARNLHFTLENTTQHTRVSIDFRIAIHRGGEPRREDIPFMSSIGPNNVKMMMQNSRILREAMQQQQEDERCNDVHDVLCHKKMLQDNYSSFAGYYEEAYVELGSSSSSPSMRNNNEGGHGPGPVVCKRNTTLMHPDRRVGFPF